jgi:hypothetical protein
MALHAREFGFLVPEPVPASFFAALTPLAAGAAQIAFSMKSRFSPCRLGVYPPYSAGFDI